MNAQKGFCLLKVLNEAITINLLKLYYSIFSQLPSLEPENYNNTFDLPICIYG